MSEYDFEGRCHVCKKRLPLMVVNVSRTQLILELVPCKEHPDDGSILWPNREDLINVTVTEEPGRIKVYG